MVQDPVDPGSGRVSLKSVTSDNWRRLDAIRPMPAQERFVAPISRYLCLSLFEDDWTSLAICLDELVVGHVMHGYDRAEDAGWIGGLVVDASHQGRGVGRAAVELLLASFRAAGHSQAALSYDADNAAARRLYLRMGFVETGEVADGELVARRALDA